MDTEIRGAVILSAHNNYQPFIGSVGIEDGRIIAVREKSLGAEPGKVADGTGKILAPGLVNGHCHGDMTIARGMGDGMTLQEQNEAFADSGWFYSLMSDDDRYDSRQLTYCESLLSGTTFHVENMFWGLGARSAKCMGETGLCGALAEDIRRDFYHPEDLLTLKEITEFGKTCGAYGLLPVIGSISEEDYECALLQKISRTAEQAGYLRTAHLAETQWRLDIVREKHGTTPVRYLADCGVLDGSLAASHVVYPDGEEINLLAQSKVGVVNTPLSEMKIADGVAPIPKMLAAGITVGLGTDGAMWNNTNDMFREMKGMALLHSLTSGVRALTAAQVFDMASVKGAAVFGMRGEIGTIEEGKRADIILIDAAAPHMTPLRVGAGGNVLSNVVFGATGRDVSDVWIGGRHLVKDRKMTSFDLRALCKRVNERSAELARRAGLPKEGYSNGVTGSADKAE